MKVVAALYLVALNVNLQNGAGRSDAARYTLALVVGKPKNLTTHQVFFLKTKTLYCSITKLHLSKWN